MCVQEIFKFVKIRWRTFVCSIRVHIHVAYVHGACLAVFILDQAKFCQVIIRPVVVNSACRIDNSMSISCFMFNLVLKMLFDETFAQPPYNSLLPLLREAGNSPEAFAVGRGVLQDDWRSNVLPPRV